jgi:3-oxoacyl-[acyl-carrier protein] reductase
MDMGIKGKVALVVASSKGLGKAVALGLADEGAKLVICARDEDRLRDTGDEIREKTGARVLTVRADVTQPEDVEYLLAAAVDSYRGIDILVTNAGGPPAGPPLSFTDEDWFKAFELNFLSAVRLIRGVIPFMTREKWGRIINITSVTVKEPVAGLMLSNAIRMSVVGFAKTLADEVAPYGITVNNVCPGWTRTDRVVELFRQRAQAQNITPEEAEAGVINNIPLGRMGTPEEFASLVVYLASAHAGYITGESILIDGGQHRSSL